MSETSNSQSSTEPQIVVRYNSATGLSIMVVGIILVALSLVVFTDGFIRYFLLGAGAAGAFLGVFFALGKPWVLVYPNEVRLKTALGTNGRTFPIDGVGDLTLSKGKLSRRSDGKVLVNLGMAGANKQDLTQLEKLIGAPTSS